MAIANNPPLRRLRAEDIVDLSWARFLQNYVWRCLFTDCKTVDSYLLVHRDEKTGREENELLTVLVIKDVITNPTELLITDQNLDISAFLQSTYSHLPVNHDEEWRKYFRIMYL